MPPEVRLGNDIARQFGALPPERAARAVADHLAKFWEPRMLDALRGEVAAANPDVDPLLVLALAHVEAGADRRPRAGRPAGP